MSKSKSKSKSSNNNRSSSNNKNINSNRMEHWVDYESAGEEDNDEDDRKPPARRTVTDPVRNAKQNKHTAPFSHDNDDDDDDDGGGNEYHEAYNAFSTEKDDENGRHHRILGIRIRGPRTNQKMEKMEMLFRPSPAERPRWKLEEDMIASLLVGPAELFMAHKKYLRDAVRKYLDTTTRTSSVTTSVQVVEDEKEDNEDYNRGEEENTNDGRTEDETIVVEEDIATPPVDRAVAATETNNKKASSANNSKNSNKTKIPGVLVDDDHWEVAGIHDFREGKQKGEETLWLLSWVGSPLRTWEPDSNLSSSCKAEAEKFRREKKPEAKTKGSDTDDSDTDDSDTDDSDGDEDYVEPSRPAKKTRTGSPRPPPAAHKMLSAAHVQGEAARASKVLDVVVSRPAKKTRTGSPRPPPAAPEMLSAAHVQGEAKVSNEVGFRVGDKVRLDWDRHFRYGRRMKYWKRTKAEGKVVVLSRVTHKTVSYCDEHGQEHRKSNHNVSKLSSFTFTEGEGHRDGNGDDATEMRAKSPVDQAR